MSKNTKDKKNNVKNDNIKNNNVKNNIKNNTNNRNLKNNIKNIPRKWTKEEEEILDKYKDKMSNIELHKKYLKDRSVVSIQSKISKSGRQRSNKKVKPNDKNESGKRRPDILDTVSIASVLYCVKGYVKIEEIYEELKSLNYDTDLDQVKYHMESVTNSSFTIEWVVMVDGDYIIYEK